MLFAEVVATSDAVAATRSRSRKIAELSVLLRRADAVPVVVGLLSGQPRQGKVGVGFAAMFGVDIAPASAPTLTVEEVDAAIATLPTLTGPGSQSARAGVISDLLGRATEPEQRFLRDLMTGGLRQGALEGIMVEAVAAASGVAADLVRRALMLHGDLSDIAEVALTQGVQGLAAIGLEVGRAVRPMLASTASDVTDAIRQIGESAVEWKLDGARIQVHRRGDDVRVFTRNLNDVTPRLPHVVKVVTAMPVEEVILDGEAMAVDEGGLPRRFQETMSSFGADEARAGVLLEPFFFDVLHLDGKDLIDRPLRERKEVLERVVPPGYRIPSVETSDPEAGAAMLAEAKAHRHEGVMVKALDSAYEAGRRGSAWLKVKPVHTLDLVILAAEWGHGRRTGWLSNLHLGARDGESFVMLGKTFKGLTDEMLAWQTERLLELEERGTKSTVYVRPKLVVEIALDGVVASPRYPAGMALRFARVKGYRPDKDPSEADSLDTVRAIFEGRI